MAKTPARKLPAEAEAAVRAIIEDERQRKEDSPWEAMKPAFDYEGSRLKLPAEPQKMPPRVAQRWLGAIADEEEKIITIHEPIRAFVIDGAVAFAKALSRHYGGATPESIPGFFGDTHPQLTAVEVGPGETQTVFWGAFKVPGIDGLLTTDVTQEDGQQIFRISGQVLHKHKDLVHRLAETTRQIVREESIYKSKAITISDKAGEITMENPPRFIDVSSPGKLVFTRELDADINALLFTPIEKSDIVRREGSLRRNILLEGPYGCGKTLLGTVTAKKATDNGWTFIYVKTAAFQAALKFATRYQPAVIFCEDIDQTTSSDKRTPELNEILNQIQGVTSNSKMELIAVMTSNEASKIHPAMMRPGRLDAILHIDVPDAEAVTRLIRLYGGDLISENEDLQEAGEILQGEIPATIAEAVQRSKLFRIARSDGGELPPLTGSDIAGAARTMGHHLKLLKQERPGATEESKLYEAFISAVQKGIEGQMKTLEPVKAQIDEIYQHVT